MGLAGPGWRPLSMISPAAIWILHPDSSWILLICSPPRPITTMRTQRTANHNRASHSGILSVLLFCRVWVRNTAITLKRIRTSCIRDVHSRQLKNTDTGRIWEMAGGFCVRIRAFKRTNAYQCLTRPSVLNTGAFWVLVCCTGTTGTLQASTWLWANTEGPLLTHIYSDSCRPFSSM